MFNVLRNMVLYDTEASTAVEQALDGYKGFKPSLFCSNS